MNFRLRIDKVEFHKIIASTNKRFTRLVPVYSLFRGLQKVKLLTCVLTELKSKINYWKYKVKFFVRIVSELNIRHIVISPRPNKVRLPIRLPIGGNNLFSNKITIAEKVIRCRIGVPKRGTRNILKRTIKKTEIRCRIGAANVKNNALQLWPKQIILQLNHR